MDFGTEAEHLSEIYDDFGYDFEPYENWEKRDYIEAKNNCFAKKDVGKYVVAQIPKYNKVFMQLMYLVDRSKTKSYWWSHDAYYAMVFEKKEAAEQQAKKYRYGKIKVMKIKPYMADRDGFDENY